MAFAVFEIVFKPLVLQGALFMADLFLYIAFPLIIGLGSNRL